MKAERENNKANKQFLVGVEFFYFIVVIHHCSLFCQKNRK